MVTVDDYLEQLRHQLQTTPEEAEEILREIRSHLELAVRDLGWNGRDETACLALALERFGAADDVGRELRRVHGRATWGETILATFPLLLFGWLAPLVRLPAWVAPLFFAAATVAGWKARWSLWWWSWLGWLPLVFPGAPQSLLWGVVAYAVLLLLVTRRDWLEATLALYPLPTAWAFHRTVLTRGELHYVGWSETAMNLLGLAMAATWIAILVHTLRTATRSSRMSRVLEGQLILFMLNGLIVVAARLWPTYPFPYPYTLRYFLFTTLPYAVFNGLPFLMFFLLTSLPAMLAIVQARTRRGPPSRPQVSS